MGENSIGKELVLFEGNEGESEEGSNKTIVIADSDQSVDLGDLLNSNNKFNALIDIPEEVEVIVNP